MDAANFWEASMKRPLVLLALAAAALPLAACVEDGYGYAAIYSTPYYGWYDNFYGPIYDGYWGTDNFFYYRLTPNDRNYRRGDSRHFRRDAVPGGSYNRFEGTIRQPPQGARMPNFPRKPQAGQPDRPSRSSDRRDRGHDGQ
jgi:hypothetical protein